MNVQDYPVTELYGCQPGYPLNQNLCPPGQGFHNGIDYGCPTGTPIVVNGVTIGISGATGAVTGPHCHVGKWVGGSSRNPGVGNGFKFNNAVVTEVNQDPTNGKYVRVQGDGASWVYLHMSDNSKVKVGQVLQGGNMPSTVDRELAGELLTAYFGPGYIAGSGGEAFIQSWVGTETNSMVRALYESPQFRNIRLDAEQTQAELRDAKAKIAQLEAGGGSGYSPAPPLYTKN